MASLQQGEKQLFEKFWEGTFRAVATPRLGSIIMASITSRSKPLASTDIPSCLALPTEVTPSEERHPAQETSKVNGCGRRKDSQEDITHKSRSPSWDAESIPHPSKGKKKKKKSTRKKRRRSPSYSVSPPKKKKKKKNSKKKKRNRISSKKKRHSSSSPKRKRKEGRKHKKHSRSRPQKSRRHHHHSSTDSTNSLSESCGSRLRSRFQDEGRKGRPAHSRHSSKRTSHPDDAGELAGSPFLGCTLQNNYFLSTTELISNSGSAAGLFKKAAGQLGNQIKQNGDPHEYDSGNATSSPPSIQTSTSRSKGIQEARCQAHGGFARASSSGKASSVSSPDSGNSFHSYSSQSKGPSLEEPSPSSRGLCKDQNGESWPSLEPLGKKKASFVSPPFSSSPLQPCLRNESPRPSPEHRQSDPSYHKAGRRSSPSRSCCSSETRFSSRSPSSSPKSGKRATGSRLSRSRRSPSYSQYRAGRGHEPDHNYGSSGKESHRHPDRRRRKQSYSPMRKRRRDSPSHLEARRITSARKRPIPYYRPSPSSSSPGSSSLYSSGSSCLSYSPARSRSYSSDRTSCSRSRSSHTEASRSSRRSSSRSSASVGSYDSLRHS